MRFSSAEHVRNGEDVSLRNNAEYGRDRAVDIRSSNRSGVNLNAAPVELETANTVDQASIKVKPSPGYSTGTKMSSMPISSTTNQILQHLLEAEQPLGHKTYPNERKMERRKERKKENEGNTVCSKGGGDIFFTTSNLFAPIMYLNI